MSEIRTHLLRQKGRRHIKRELLERFKFRSRKELNKLVRQCEALAWADRDKQAVAKVA